MTQYVRAINIANNSIKSFVFDTNTSNTLNTAVATAEVVAAVAISANVSAQAVNTFVTLQTLQVANTPPTINTISITDSSYNILDDTAANVSGAYLAITGTNFQSGAIVMVGSGNTALSTTFIDSNNLRAQIPAIAAGTYPVYVVNTNGGTAIRYNGLTTSPFPVWVSATSLANTPSGNLFSVTLSATSDTSITFSNVTALPSGTTVAANGLFSGTVPFVENNTTYNFTVAATDAELQNTNKAFSVDITPNFTLWGWGSNSNNGYLPEPAVYGTAYSSPVQLATTRDWTNIIGTGLRFIGRKYDGTLQTWGDALLGQGTTVGLRGPSRVRLGSGSNWNIPSNFNDRVTNQKIIIDDNTLWAWGLNGNGQNGTNNRTVYSSPVQIGTGTDWRKVVCNVQATATAAIKTNGTLWAWGNNTWGQLGLGDTVDRSSPVQVGSETDWSDVTNADQLFYGIKTDGTLWGCGFGDLQPFGATNRSSPVQIGTDTNWSKIFSGGDTKTVSNSRACLFALKTDGTLWAWGVNTDGQLGQNNRTNKSSPTQVGTGTNWSQFGFAVKYAIATKTDGTLWTWGENTDGQLGQNDRVSRSSPIQVGTNTNWYGVAAIPDDGGYQVSFAISRN